MTSMEPGVCRGSDRLSVAAPFLDGTTQRAVAGISRRSRVIDPRADGGERSVHDLRQLSSLRRDDRRCCRLQAPQRKAFF